MRRLSPHDAVLWRGRQRRGGPATERGGSAAGASRRDRGGVRPARRGGPAGSGQGVVGGARRVRGERGAAGGARRARGERTERDDGEAGPRGAGRGRRIRALARPRRWIRVPPCSQPPDLGGMDAAAGRIRERGRGGAGERERVWRGRICVGCWRTLSFGSPRERRARPKRTNGCPIWVRAVGDSLTRAGGERGGSWKVELCSQM